jgi:CelD/BcsL family acetyltransferase involved in cellulose biosynthesis
MEGVKSYSKTGFPVQPRLLSGFDDPAITPGAWNDLLHRGSSDVVFMSWHWQKAWWEAFGRGKLLLVAAQQKDELIALAPLFADQGMVYLVGSGGSDYLDLIGRVDDVKVLEDMLRLAADNTPDFTGFCFYHVLESSGLSGKLQEVADRLGWKLFEEGVMPAPLLDLKENPERAYQSTRKKSLLRHEAYFNRNGGVVVEHLTESGDILPCLEAFFSQHVQRWAATPYPSLFNEPGQRLFYRKLADSASESRWVRFTRVLWRGRVISGHFGFNYQGSFLWYKPSFDVELSRNSPGEVLLRRLILRAQEEQARIFDFGLGDEFFKKRFATGTRKVYTWGLYPPASLNKERGP